MIETKETLKRYNSQDAELYCKVSHGILSTIKNRLVTNTINTQYYIYQYVRFLRKAEYHQNNSMFENKRSIYHTLMTMYYYYRLRKNSYKTGFQIPPNTCGSGLQIWHYGYIIINSHARIGKNATIYPGVEIGLKQGPDDCPIIGDNCFIGAGAKIFGRITIGDNVTIAANSVVTKDIPSNCIVGGCPAKILKTK